MAVLTVAGKARSWVEGKVLCFDDSFMHDVWHNGTKTRAILIVDVAHPGLWNPPWEGYI